MNEKCLSVPMIACLSTDDHCVTKPRQRIKIYTKDKHFKWGYKLFMLFRGMALALKITIYSMQENDRMDILTFWWTWYWCQRWDCWDLSIKRNTKIPQLQYLFWPIFNICAFGYVSNQASDPVCGYDLGKQNSNLQI